MSSNFSTQPQARKNWATVDGIYTDNPDPGPLNDISGEYEAKQVLLRSVFALTRPPGVFTKVDHVLLHGLPGLGKKTLARSMILPHPAKQIQTQFVEITYDKMRWLKEKFQWQEAIASLVDRGTPGHPLIIHLMDIERLQEHDGIPDFYETPRSYVLSRPAQRVLLIATTSNIGLVNKSSIKGFFRMVWLELPNEHTVAGILEIHLQKYQHTLTELECADLAHAWLTHPRDRGSKGVCGNDIVHALWGASLTVGPITAADVNKAMLTFAPDVWFTPKYKDEDED